MSVQIVEGVHLSPRVVLALMQKIPNAVPFLVVIRRATAHANGGGETTLYTNNTTSHHATPRTSRMRINTFFPP